jgi:hypothetical protein
MRRYRGLVTIGLVVVWVMAIVMQRGALVGSAATMTHVAAIAGVLAVAVPIRGSLCAWCSRR